MLLRRRSVMTGTEPLINNVIVYEAPAKLTETTDVNTAGLHTDAFGNATIVSHTFENGQGTIIFNKNITTIGTRAFYYTGITSVTIPIRTTDIGYGAFAWCENLVSVTIPDYVTSIGESAFSNCRGLTSITIPNRVTSIEDYAFNYCSNLASVTIPNSVERIGRNVFSKTAWYDNQPNGLVYAGKVAYTYKGTMPAATSVVIEEGTIGIAGGALASQSGLVSVTIPDSVTNIGNFALYMSANIVQIICKPIIPPAIGNGSISIKKTGKIYVPSGSVDAYKSASGWSSYASYIEAIPT